MNYRTIKLRRHHVQDLLRQLHPEVPSDARLARATLDFGGGMTLTISSDRFGPVRLRERPPAFSRDDGVPRHDSV